MSQGQRMLAAIMFTNMVGYAAQAAHASAKSFVASLDHRGLRLYLRPYSRKAISRSASIGIVVILVIAAAVGIYYMPSSPVSPTSITSTPPTSTSGPLTATTLPTSRSTPGVAPPSFVSDNTLVYETIGNFQALDPSVSYYLPDYGILQNVFEKLLWLNGENSTQILPWLASDYSTNDGGKTYIFHLRQNVKFADGTPFNATAVWFSMNRLLILDGTAADQSVHGSGAAWILQQLLNRSLSAYFSGDQSYSPDWVQSVLDENFVQVIDPYTIQFNIMHPSASFPYLLANEWADIVSPSWTVGHDDPTLLRSHMTTADYIPYLDEFAGLNKLTSMIVPTGNNLPVMAGTGPYYISSVDPTSYNVVLKANPNYWGGPSGFTVAGQAVTIGQPRIKTIYINYVPDTNTRILDLGAGKATIIDTEAADIYSVADRNAWLGQGQLVSIIPGATIHGTYPTLITNFFTFSSNVTTLGGAFRNFQPFADWRLREAVRVSVNMSALLITVANRLAAPANELVPPGTAPAGAHSDTLPLEQFNLTLATQLLQDVAANPLTSANSVMHYYNGTVMPAGVVDNSFSPSNPKTITLVYAAGGTTGQNIVNQIAINLNKITVHDNLGLTFETEPLPIGNMYTQVDEHHLDFALGGWAADYNWVSDWLSPMFLSTGTYFSGTLWNNTSIDKLVRGALAADASGNLTGLVSLAQQAQMKMNHLGYYMLRDYPLAYFPTSSWLQGFYYNIGIGDSGIYFPTYSYAAPTAPSA